MAITHRLIETKLATITGDGATTLTAAASTFITDGVLAAGDLVFNTTDNSTATIVSIDSETQITTTALTGGSDNSYDVAAPDLIIFAQADPTAVFPQNHRDQHGYLQVETAGGSPTATFVVEMRADSEASWATVLTLNQLGVEGSTSWTFSGATPAAPGSFITKSIPILPQVRVRLTAFDGTGAMSFGVWLIE